MKISNHILIPGLGLAASLPLLFLSNVPAVFLGGIGTAGSTGYIASGILTADARKKAQQAIARQEKALNTREQQLSTRYQNATADLERQIEVIEAKLHLAEDARDEAIKTSTARVRAIKEQRAHLIAEAKIMMGEELTRKFEADYAEKLATATADFSRREDEFYHAEGELCDQIEALQAVLSQNEDYLKEEFCKETGAEKQKWANRYKVLLDEIEKYGQAFGVVKKEGMAEVHQKDLAIAELRGQVKLLSAPRKYRGSSQDDKTANAVLEFFLNKSVSVEAEDWGRKYHQLTVWLFPKDATLPQLELLMDELQQALGLYARPVVSIDRSCFKIVCDTDAKVAAKATIKEPPLSKLEQAISDAIQVRIAAPSGSGKSVLLGNMVNYLSHTYLSTYELYDPKVTAREVWGELTPTHYSTDCLPAIFSLADTCLDRINLCKKAAENDTAPPRFNPEFHIVDELEFCYGLVDISDSKDYTSKKFATNIKTALKVGREHKIKLLFVTQSALCSDINLKKNDFFNTTSLFLGQTIIEALDSDLMGAVSAERKAVLRAEYKARLARGDKYTILVYEPEKPTEAWLCAAPSPGHYAALASESATKTGQTENPVLGGVATCPHVEGNQGQTHAAIDVASGDGSEGAREEKRNGDNPATNLATVLAHGTHCPKCSHHTASYKKKTPSSTGKVSVKCTNKECSTKTFSWKVV
ncbi:MAG: hypothetical protein AAFV85_26810 [Cyanobacteria bacterium J06634_6]